MAVITAEALKEKLTTKLEATHVVSFVVCLITFANSVIKSY